MDDLTAWICVGKSLTTVAFRRLLLYVNIMKRNILISVYHLQHGFLGSGYVEKEPQDKPDSYFETIMNTIHDNGFRDGSITLWEKYSLVGFGKDVVANSTFDISVVEFPE